MRVAGAELLVRLDTGRDIGSSMQAIVGGARRALYVGTAPIEIVDECAREWVDLSDDIAGFEKLQAFKTGEFDAALFFNAGERWGIKDWGPVVSEASRVVKRRVGFWGVPKNLPVWGAFKQINWGNEGAPGNFYGWLVQDKDLSVDRTATHIPLLAAAVARTRGDVLEFGCGDYSTPMLHNMLAGTGRKLVSLETNKEWLERYADLRGPGHVLAHVTDWRDAILPGKFSVAFVDCQPGEARALLVKALADSAEFIIAHDTEDDGYGYEPVFADFKHRLDYDRFDPMTTLVSNVQPFTI